MREKILLHLKLFFYKFKRRRIVELDNGRYAYQIKRFPYRLYYDFTNKKVRATDDYYVHRCFHDTIDQVQEKVDYYWPQVRREF